ncbi:MAG: acylglycerol kinase family protein [Kordiimonadaceae bacterium]|jgi:diacylglycerol kinase family enzyme|nr:acylglycerol kinase family protein [Kordiimonadaceae bacterium]MBT6033717.1 acylglycerol kinase family protein [Kordiimonadaceae bacterium]
MNKFRKILIIYNPNAGQRHRSKFEKIIKKLEIEKIYLQVVATEYAGHGKEIARQYSGDNNYDMIVAAGGDGTIN